MRKPVLLQPASMSDAELIEIYTLMCRCKLAAAPEEPYYRADELAAMERALPAGMESWEWAVEGGLALLSRKAGETHGNVELVVAPEARRRGVGRQLAEVVIEQARAIGCPRVVGRFADETGAAFARSLGATFGNSALVSKVDLAEAVAEPEPVPGYSIRSWADEPPAELVESWIVAMNAIDDAPQSEGVEDAPITLEEVRDVQKRAVARGKQMRVTVVVDAAGDVVGATYLIVGNEKGAVARTGDTSVMPEHRRKGLARWLKAESLLWLKSDRPDVSFVRTSNDSTNVGMLAVNHAAGFRTVATYTHAIVDLS